MKFFVSIVTIREEKIVYLSMQSFRGRWALLRPVHSAMEKWDRFEWNMRNVRESGRGREGEEERIKEVLVMERHSSVSALSVLPHRSSRETKHQNYFGQQLYYLFILLVAKYWLLCIALVVKHRLLKLVTYSNSQQDNRHSDTELPLNKQCVRRCNPSLTRKGH